MHLPRAVTDLFRHRTLLGASAGGHKLLLALSLALLPQSARACHPTLLCVEDLGGGVYRARFGFVGSESLIAIGPRNTFVGPALGCTASGSGVDCGQGTNFSAPQIADHVRVRFPSDKSLTWTLNGSSVTARVSSKRCLSPSPSSTPSPTPSPTPTQPPTASPSPSPTPTPAPVVRLCHIPQNAPASAVSLLVPAADLSTHLTHGDLLGECPVDCMGIPFGRAAIDLCGVCGGDSSTCRDCAGTPNGTRHVDTCGVCDGDGSSCKGCDGIANSGKVLDACGVCGGDSSRCKDCLGVPNGGAAIDACGVCGGTNTTCRDCLGIINGPARIDACGICGGDSRSCASTPKCEGIVDACGVCNGSGACLDCAGVPNGEATIDCCGVCGGDGTSCPELCTTYNLRTQKRALTRSLIQLYRSVSTYSTREAQCSKAGALRSARRLRVAEQLRRQSTQLLSSVVADEIRICNTVYCKKTSLKGTLASIRSDLTRLYKLSRQAQYGAGDACGRAPRTSPSRRLTTQEFQRGASRLRSIPGEQCIN